MRPTPNKQPAPAPRSALSDFDLATAEGRAQATLAVARIVNAVHCQNDQLTDLFADDDRDEVLERKIGAAFHALNNLLWTAAERAFAMADNAVVKPPEDV